MKAKVIKSLFSKIPPLINCWPLIFAFFIFTLLLAKNPFSNRTLIPNFEPFPDAFYYIVVPKCWLQGEGWRLCREGVAGIDTQVSPLYSIFLSPFLALKNDPRIFYVGNIILALTGLSFFYLIINKMLSFKNKFYKQVLVFFTLFLYITSYHLYWYPTLAMASNLLIPLFIIGLYLLLLPISLPVVSFSFLIGLSFVATKFSAIPLTLTYLIILLFRIIIKYKNNQKLLAKIILLAGSILLFFSVLTNFYLIKLGLKTAYRVLFFNKETDWFAFYHFPKNIIFYLNTILGKPAKVLWDVRPFYPTWVGIGATIGYTWALTKKQSFALNTLLLFASQIIFMSLFYDYDGRYIFIAFPVILIGFAYFLSFGLNLFNKTNNKNIFLLLISIVFIIFGFHNFIRIKSQISLNLKYAEQPWYYLSVLEFNNFFAKPTTLEKPILISSVAPFLIDFYSNDNYSLLPLSSIQEFRSQKKNVWGKNNYSNLIKLYQLKIDEGYEVYVTNYGLGNNGSKIGDFKLIESSFTLKKVSSGCHDQCNIYKLSL